MKTYSGNTAWNFVNGVIYSLTVVSTIGNFENLVVTIFRIFLY